MTYRVDILGDCFAGPETVPTSPSFACLMRCGRLWRDGLSLMRTFVPCVMMVTCPAPHSICPMRSVYRCLGCLNVHTCSQVDKIGIATAPCQVPEARLDASVRLKVSPMIRGSVGIARFALRGVDGSNRNSRIAGALGVVAAVACLQTCCGALGVVYNDRGLRPAGRGALWRP